MHFPEAKEILYARSILNLGEEYLGFFEYNEYKMI